MAKVELSVEAHAETSCRRVKKPLSHHGATSVIETVGGAFVTIPEPLKGSKAARVRESGIMDVGDVGAVRVVTPALLDRNQRLAEALDHLGTLDVKLVA